MSKKSCLWIIFFLSIIFAKEIFASEDHWQVEFMVRANGTSDQGPILGFGNPIFGVEAGASDGYDVGIDIPTPPPSFKGLNVYFPNDGDIWSALKKDIRDSIPSGGSRRWTFYVQAVGLPQVEIILTWGTLSSSVPTGYSLTLRDVDEPATRNMRTESEYKYIEEGSSTRHFEVTVSDASQPPAPNISVNPTSLSFTATEGGSNPANKTFQISNTGGGSLNWTASDNAAWLSLSPISGSGNATVIASVNIDSLSAGTYNATITVSDPAASNSPRTVTVNLTISGGQSPPNISVNPASLSFSAVQGGNNPAGQNFVISNTGGGSLNWTASDNAAWLSLSPISGSGNATVIASVNIDSLSAGTYNGIITVSDPAASNSPRTVTVALIINQQSSPAANFTATPLTGCAPCTVSFTDLSTGNITGWYWDFGDGDSSHDKNPTHTYTTSGVHTVSLNVTNGGQYDRETKTDYITINNCPTVTADFSATPLSGCVPCTVSFTDSSAGDNIIDWFWSFGDGNRSIEPNPIYTYTIPGIYTVSLTVFDGSYASKTKIDYITINSCLPLTANFSATPLSGYAPLEVNFTDLSTGNPTSWTWDFGDGDTGSVSSPTHIYTDSGTYIVTLTVFNGLSDSEKVSIVVIAPPEYFLDVLIYPNPCRMNNGDDYIYFTNLPPDSSIRIYNIARELVRFEREISGSFCWDMKNDDGRMVSPGIYIYLIEKDGRIKKGKIAVIR